MTSDLNAVKELCYWMISTVAANREAAIVDGYCDWDWVAGEVWSSYPGIVNEFMINDAIDLIAEAARCSE